jgi:crotonobetaine/carnitine-CoA ligase
MLATTRTQGTPLPDLLRMRAREFPDRIYVVDVDDRCLTYAEMGALVDHWAEAYQRLGITAGEHVVTMQYNTIESLAGWLGLASIGAIEAPINTDYRGELLAHALNLTRAGTLLLLHRYLYRVLDIAKELPHLRNVIVLDAEGAVSDSAPFNIVPGRVFLDVCSGAYEQFSSRMWDIGAVMFTSGTTGPSKAVRMPWGQIHATTTGTLPLRDLGPDDVFFNAGPTFHIGAKVFPLLAALVGGRHVMRPFVSESKQPEEYRKYGVTTCFFPPFAWLDEPPRPDDAQCALRNILFPLLHPRMAEFKGRFGCRTFSVYSMTELSCPIADTDWDIGYVNEDGLFSCGKLRSGDPGYEARLVDEWDQPVEDGTVGELVVRASMPWTMNAGYLNDPVATASAWRNGWFHTGDAFSRDREGRFYFRDRIKDCIRRRAENISSFEVEAAVRKHPAIADCAAVGVKRWNEPGADEEIKVVVVRAAGADLDPAELIHWMIPNTPRFMIPRYIEFVDELPRTPTLKVRKAALRDQPLGAGVWDREQSGIVLPR